MMTRKLVTLTLAALLLTAAAVSAQPGRGRGCDDDGPGLLNKRLAERLDLTDDQKESLEKLREERRDAMGDLRKQMRKLRHELQGQMLEDDPSEDAVVELTRRIGALRTDMQVERAKGRLALREVLTEDQRDELMMMRKRGGGRGGPRGGGQGRFGPGGFGPGHGCEPGCDSGRHGKGFRGRNAP